MSDDKQKKDVDPATDPDVDGGYAWVILAGCFLSYMCAIGSVKAYGVLYTEIVSYFGSGSGSTAWIGSTVLLGTLGLAPIANMLGKTFSFRRVSLVGGILLGLGYFLSGFVARIELMFLTFGLCSGIGYGFSFSPCSTIISYYFKKHRALANGIVVSASGVGAIGLPFIYKYLIHEYGLKGAFWIIGALLSHTCVSACLFRQPRMLVEEKRQQLLQRQKHIDQDSENTDSRSTVVSCCRSLGGELKFSLFKNPRFTLYVVAFVFSMNGFGNNLILIPSQIKALGYDKFYIALGVTIMGACETVSRIFSGWFADLKLVKTKYIFLVSMSVSALISFLAPALNSFELMALYAGLVGIFPGSIWSQLPILVIDVVGMEHFPPAFGLVLMCLAVGCVISQPIVGWLEDSTGNWNASFILTGCLFLCAVLILCLENPIIRLISGSKLTSNKTPDANGVEPKLERIPLQEDPTMINEESDSLLHDDKKFNDKFTSPRISRIYRPYNPESRRNQEPSSPAPIADTQEV